MKTFIAVLAIVAVVAADVSHLRGPDADAQIVEQSADVFPDQFRYLYKTSNGISVEESGVLKNPGQENEGIAVQGSSSYTAPDGNVYGLTYVADENGYQPQGAHLPTPPPPQEIPEYVLRAIAYNAAHAEKPQPGSKF